MPRQLKKPNQEKFLATEPQSLTPEEKLIVIANLEGVLPDPGAGGALRILNTTTGAYYLLTLQGALGSETPNWVLE